MSRESSFASCRSLLAQAAFYSGTCVFEKLNESFLCLFTLLNLTLEHVLNTIADIIYHPSQLLLSLFPLLPLLLELLVKLGDLFREYIDENLSTLLTLLALLLDYRFDSRNLGSKSITVSIVAFFSRFFLSCQLEAQVVKFLVYDLACLDFVLLTMLLVSVQLKMDASLSLLNVCVSSLLLHSSLILLAQRLHLKLAQLIAHYFNPLFFLFFLCADLIRDQRRSLGDRNRLRRVHLRLFRLSTSRLAS